MHVELIAKPVGSRNSAPGEDRDCIRPQHGVIEHEGREVPRESERGSVACRDRVAGDAEADVVDGEAVGHQEREQKPVFRDLRSQRGWRHTPERPQNNTW